MHKWPAVYANFHGVSALIMADFMMSQDAELERDVRNQLVGASRSQLQRTTDPKAVPFWTPKEHICKLQEMVGVLWGGGVLSET